MKKAIIIGNSGSGKSYLARQLGNHLALPVTHLDELFWEPGGFTQKRPQALVQQDIETIKGTPRWIVEGVFGDLVTRFLDSADSLIWLDMNWGYCRRNLLRRGSESQKQVDKVAAEESFQRLLMWASRYWSRSDSRSYTGHSALFDSFPQQKWVLHSRSEVDRLIIELTRRS